MYAENVAPEILGRKHFQAVKIKLTPRKAAYSGFLLFLDPFVIHRLVYYGRDSWMFYYGDNAYSQNYDAEHRKKVSFVLLYADTMALNAAVNAAAMILVKRDTGHPLW